MATVHFVLQGKGGVGKSFIAALLLQYFKLKDFAVHAFDTDPVNQTLAGYKEFDVSVLPIMKDTNVDPRMFDSLMETALGLPADAQLIIDNGSSSFIPLCSYLLENEAINLLQARGIRSAPFDRHGGHGIWDTVKAWPLSQYFRSHCCLAETNYGGTRPGRLTSTSSKSSSSMEPFHSVIELPLHNSATFAKPLRPLGPPSIVRSRIQSSQPIWAATLGKYWNDVCYPTWTGKISWECA
jgi:hypothetical protein